MKFEIRLPAIAGDVIPLFSIADAMARSAATAGGTDFHQPTFDGRRARYESMLMKHVRDGRLPACDDDGDPGEPAAIVRQRMARGAVTVLKDIAPSPGTTGHQAEPVVSAKRVLESLALDIDLDQTWLFNLFVNLKSLNEWASSMGHEFTVTHEGVQWVDERGLQPPPGTGAAGEAGLRPGASDAGATEPAVVAANAEAPAAAEPVQARGPATSDVHPARLRIQQEAAEVWIRWLAMGGNPTVHSISEVLATWCAENDVRTSGGVNPRAGTIRNTILGAGHWTPPNMSRKKAKEHVAQVAQVAHAHVAQVAQDKG